MKFKISDMAALSSPGMRRENNEDSFYFSAKNSLACVADGMGGHSYGEDASKMACESIKNWFKQKVNLKSTESPTDRLRLAFDYANSVVNTRLGMYSSGTTLVCAYLHDNNVLIANAGDSRCYKVRDGKIKQITEDHSALAQLKKNYPELKDKELSGVGKNVITNAIGLKPNVQVDVFRSVPQAGDIYLLCSDGLTNEVHDNIIAMFVKNANNCNHAAKLLVDCANKNGGKDNITVVLFEVREA